MRHIPALRHRGTRRPLPNPRAPGPMFRLSSAEACPSAQLNVSPPSLISVHGTGALAAMPVNRPATSTFQEAELAVPRVLFPNRGKGRDVS